MTPKPHCPSQLLAANSTPSIDNKRKRADASEPLSVRTGASVVHRIEEVRKWVTRPLEARQADAQQRGHIPRPINCFMLYRRAFIDSAIAMVSIKQQHVLSAIIADSWRRESADVREQFEQLANIEKYHHRELWPDYKFSPSSAKPRTSACSLGNTADSIPVSQDHAASDYEPGNEHRAAEEYCSTAQSAVWLSKPQTCCACLFVEPMPYRTMFSGIVPCAAQQSSSIDPVETRLDICPDFCTYQHTTDCFWHIVYEASWQHCASAYCCLVSPNN
jgi:hypothetical protein